MFVAVCVFVCILCVYLCLFVYICICKHIVFVCVCVCACACVWMYVLTTSWMQHTVEQLNAYKFCVQYNTSIEDCVYASSTYISIHLPWPCAPFTVRPLDGDSWSTWIDEEVLVVPCMTDTEVICNGLVGACSSCPSVKFTTFAVTHGNRRQRLFVPKREREREMFRSELSVSLYAMRIYMLWELAIHYL